MDSMVKNAADESQVKEAEKKIKHEKQQEIHDLKNIMQTAQGRRFIYKLITFCGVFKTSYTGNSGTFYNEGMRNVGLMIMSEINEHCPELYVSMLNESREVTKEKRNG